MRCLVTGAGGFIGSHLVEYLVARGDGVTAAYHHPARSEDVPDRVDPVVLDILDADEVQDAVRRAEPDVVFHLAAQSLPVVSWNMPQATFQVNVMGTLKVLEAVRSSAAGAKVLVLCSSSQYAPVGERPVTEDDVQHPASPYAASKIAVDNLAALYASAHRLRVMRARPFSVIGPRKVNDSVSDLARGIVAVERNEARHVRVGNLSAVRDFVDVSDALDAFALIVDRGTGGGAYNVCTSTGTSISEILRILSAQSTVAIATTTDAERLRPLDEPVRIGDSSRLRALGWAPRVKLEDTLAAVLRYWRAR